MGIALIGEEFDLRCRTSESMEETQSIHRLTALSPGNYTNESYIIHSQKRNISNTLPSQSPRDLVYQMQELCGGRRGNGAVNGAEHD